MFIIITVALFTVLQMVLLFKNWFCDELILTINSQKLFINMYGVLITFDSKSITIFSLR